MGYCSTGSFVVALAATVAVACGTFGETDPVSAPADSGVVEGGAPDAAPPDAAAEDAADGGCRNYALRFSGGQWLDVMDDAQLDGFTALTIEAWLRPEQHTGTDGAVVSHGPPSGSKLAGYTLGVSGPLSRAKLTISNGLGTDTTGGATDSQSVPAGRFTHVAVTFDGALKKAVLYIDGVVKATNGMSYTSITDASGVLRIGASPLGGASGYRGLIDELRISKAVKYAAAFTPPSAALAVEGDTVALWHFDEGTGVAAADANDAHPASFAGGANAPEWMATPCISDYGK